METILAAIAAKAGIVLAAKGAKIGLAVLLAPIFGFIIKKIPLEALAQAVSNFFEPIGVWISTRGNRGWWASIYNNTAEPWFILLLKCIFGAALGGLVKGMQSDNEPKK